MAVSVTFSESINGAALSDSLAGGGSGLDLGSVVNGSFSPVTDKTNNVGRQDIFIRHDATIDPITGCKFYLGLFGGITGFTYGGARTAAGDYTAIKTMGNSSGSSKNNADGLSSGIWIDQRFNASNSAQFDIGTYPTKVKIFGDSGTDGIDLASAFDLITDAMVYDNLGTETAASAPVLGVIGKAGDTAKGDNAHIRLRTYLAAAFAEGGIYMSEIVFSYSYTA